MTQFDAIEGSGVVCEYASSNSDQSRLMCEYTSSNSTTNGALFNDEMKPREPGPFCSQTDFPNESFFKS